MAKRLIGSGCPLGWQVGSIEVWVYSMVVHILRWERGVLGPGGFEVDLLVQDLSLRCRQRNVFSSCKKIR